MNSGEPVFATGDRTVETKTAAAALSALGAQGTAEKGAANGYAGLGADGKVPDEQLPDDLGGDPAAAIHAADTQDTPVDADELGLVASAASWALRKFTWANLKSTLKPYFDGLYSAIGHTHAYEPANENIQAHVTGTGSPHTAAGVGADAAGTAAGAVSSHTSTYDHTKLHDPATVSGPGIEINGQQISLDVDYFDPAGEATGAVADHESAYDHSKIHDPVTVVGNGITLNGQQVNLEIGSGATQVAAGNHQHAGVYDVAGSATGAVEDHETEYDHDLLVAHLSDFDNPHEVTSEQVGADPAGTGSGEVVEHEGRYNHALIGVSSVDRSINMFRVTLESGVPVSTTDQTAKTLLYLCPVAGGAATEAQMSLYDGSAWVTRSFAQPSLGTTTTRNGTTTNGSAVITGLATTKDLVVGQEITGVGVGAASVIASIDSDSQVTGTVNSTASATVSVTFKCPANKNYDLFCVDIAGTPTFVFGPVWTSDTARATAITQKDGVPCLEGDFVVAGETYAEGRLRHVGMVRTTATAGQTEDTYGGGTTVSPKRFIWSVANQVLHDMCVEEDTDHTLNSTTWQQMRAQTDNRVEFIIGSPQVVTSRFSAFFMHVVGTNSAEVGIGLDRTNGVDSNYGAFGGTAISYGGEGVALSRQLSAGYHYLAMVQRTATTGAACTFFGTAGSGFESQKTMLTAEVLG